MMKTEEEHWQQQMPLQQHAPLIPSAQISVARVSAMARNTHILHLHIMLIITLRLTITYTLHTDQTQTDRVVS